MGIRVGPSEAVPFWTDFLRSLIRRGLHGVKRVRTDAHESLRALFPRPPTRPRSAVAYISCITPWPMSARASGTMVAARLRTVFAQDSRTECQQQWRLVADHLREKHSKIATLMDGCEDEVLAHMAFPKTHRQQLHSTIHWNGSTPRPNVASTSRASFPTTLQSHGS